VQQYNQMGMTWPKHSDWMCLRPMDQSQAYYWVMPYSRSISNKNAVM